MFDGRFDSKIAQRCKNLFLARTCLSEAEADVRELLTIIQDDHKAREKKALWRSAFINYATCFVSGRTEFRKPLESVMNDEEKKCHDKVLETRNKFLAHNDQNRYTGVILRVDKDQNGIETIGATVFKIENPPPAELEMCLRVIQKLRVKLAQMTKAACERLLLELKENPKPYGGPALNITFEGFGSSSENHP